MLRGIYSAIYGEVKVSVSGACVLQYAGGTAADSWFIAGKLKIWSGRKLLDPTTYNRLKYKWRSFNFVTKTASSDDSLYSFLKSLISSWCTVLCSPVSFKEIGQQTLHDQQLICYIEMQTDDPQQFRQNVQLAFTEKLLLQSHIQ
jgi:hypothetical protein